MEEQDYIAFDAYLSEELSETERVAFEKRLQEDAEFRNSYELYRETSEFLKNTIENEEATTAFKENLQKISNAHFEEAQPAKKGKLISFIKYAVAASVVLLIGVLLFKPGTQPAYEDFMTYDTLSLTVRGEESDTKQKAEKAFNTKNFKEAEAYLTTLLETDAGNQELMLYKGVALLEQDKLTEATDLFETISRGTSVFKGKALWYLALTKLKGDDLEGCKSVLKALPKEAENYAQAQELLQALE
jgi:thioredoxin-like negative regulator of GroEL